MFFFYGVWANVWAFLWIEDEKNFVGCFFFCLDWLGSGKVCLWGVVDWWDGFGNLGGYLCSVRRWIVGIFFFCLLKWFLVWGYWWCIFWVLVDWWLVLESWSGEKCVRSLSFKIFSDVEQGISFWFYMWWNDEECLREGLSFYLLARDLLLRERGDLLFVFDFLLFFLSSTFLFSNFFFLEWLWFSILKHWEPLVLLFCIEVEGVLQIIGCVGINKVILVFFHVFVCPIFLVGE